MRPLTVGEYDALERAIDNGTRVAIRRRQHEYVVVPERLSSDGGREQLHTRHPTTGERLQFFLDDLEGLEVVR